MNEQKVYIIDDDESIRDAITFLLDSIGIKSESYASAKQFLDSYTNEMHGCIVSDVRMARISGLMMQKQLNEVGCRMPIIFITGHADVQMAVQALKDGAFDFIQKPFHKDALLDCVNHALEKYESNGQKRSESESVLKRVKQLTNRETEVLKLLLEGQSSKSISRELNISPRTVDVHRQNILNKLEVKSVAAMISRLSSMKEMIA